ncbi:hypothetical protein HJG60_011792 [Phyllostomus discolor]|uniref:Uncharacterized protein n=1 Tax=Phyllostomus discolor TaxID=89673 RepID=A0A833ZLI0_9CHIR|nr:hypothetical protein HJG60_011792 [Phyllostomus discolor]
MTHFSHLSRRSQVTYHSSSRREPALLPSLQSGAGVGLLPPCPCPPGLLEASWESLFGHPSGFAKLEMSKPPPLPPRNHLVAPSRVHLQVGGGCPAVTPLTHPVAPAGAIIPPVLTFPCVQGWCGGQGCVGGGPPKMPEGKRFVGNAIELSAWLETSCIDCGTQNRPHLFCSGVELVTTPPRRDTEAKGSWAGVTRTWD